MAHGLPADPPMLRVSGLSKSYGHRLALDGVTSQFKDYVVTTRPE